MYSKLYEKHIYTNKNIEFIISDNIYEYDMSSAGFNICKSLNLLTNVEINEMEGLTKFAKAYRIGLKQKNDKEFTKKLNSGFVEYRRRFFEANNIQDDDIISIKRDAIFTTKLCNNMNFDYVTYAIKNTYTSYYNINKLEFYYNENTIDVKGISDDNLKLHEDGMLLFFKRFFYMQEHSDDISTIKYLKRFITQYKRLELPKEYYREFNRDSCFRTFGQFRGLDICYKDITSIGLDEIDIRYNLCKFINMFISLLL